MRQGEGTSCYGFFDVRSDEHSVVKLEPRFPDRPAFDLVAVVDPVSRGAQKIAPVLDVLRQVGQTGVANFLPASKIACLLTWDT